jgi:hypothetical protein
MPIDTSIYNNIQQFKAPDMQEAQAKAASLSGLAMQQAHGMKQMQQEDKEAQYTDHLRKASQFGEELDGLVSMKPEERAAYYPKWRETVVSKGLMGEQDLPPEYDDGYTRQLYQRRMQTKEGMESQLAKLKIQNQGLEGQKTKAEIAKLYAEAKHKGSNDPLANAMAMMDMREQYKKRDEQEKIKNYSKVGGWQLAEDATPTMQDSKLFKEGASETRVLMGSLNRLQELVDDHGTEAYGKNAREMEKLIRDIQLQAKGPAMYQLGVLTGPDMGLLEQIVDADPTSFTANLNPLGAARAKDSLQSLRDLVNRNIEAKAVTYGFQPTDEWKSIAGGPQKKKSLDRNSGSVNAGEMTNTQNTPKTSEDAEAIHWAKQNKNDPRAKQILQLHGEE